MNTSIKNTIKLFAATLLLSATSLIAGAQAVLPTAWDFDVAAPTGWTEFLAVTNGTTRYTNGQSGQACKLDGTGEYVRVDFAEEPGAVTYYLKGNNTGGNFAGTFTVQESADGNTWTTMQQWVDAALSSASYTQYTNNPLATSRHIRWYFTNKVSGNNVGLDQITLATPIAGVNQEINVSVGATNIPSGVQYSTGNAASTNFTIANQGSGADLTISDISLSGADAADFSLANIPTTLAPNTSSDLTLNFAPTGTGSRFCTITITNNDTSEGVYVINIYAIAGTLASEPSAQAAGVTFTTVSSWDYNVVVNGGTSNAENFIVLRKKGSAVTEAPADGSSYIKGDWIGGAQVVYVGGAATFNARYIEANTAYHFAVFAYNGPSGFENYLTAAPAINSVTTNGANIGSYYTGLNHNSANFVTDLTAALSPSNYFQVYYSNFTSTMIDEYYVRDTSIAGVSVNWLECQYSGVPETYAGGFQWWNGANTANLSREHTFPQSWMPTYNNSNFADSYEVSDLHNLLPVRQVDCNAVRSNYPYGEVVTPSSQYMGTKFGTNAAGVDVYEPRDEIKGDVARSEFYEATRYNTPTSNFSLPETISFLIPYGPDEYLLKKWHFQDLPTNYEISRNDYVKTKQNNRNAFIDSVLYPCFIRFSTLTKFVPNVTFFNNQLTAGDQAISYQWYMDGNPINGATTSTYTPTTSGAYSVAIQQFSQCPVQSSASLTVGVDNIDDKAFGVAVYPNPSNGNFKLNISAEQNENAQIRILDATGKLVHTVNQVVTHGDNAVTLNLNLATGVYMCDIKSATHHSSVRLVVQ